MNRRANTRLSRFSYVLGLIALTVLTGLAITAASTDAAGVRLGFVEGVATWFGGGAMVNVVAEPQPTPESEAPENNTYHNLASSNFSQNWNNTSLITTDDDWSGVPSIIGYRGDGLSSSTATDPQTVLAPSSVVNVDAQSSTTNTTGGVHEIESPIQTIAIQGSTTADAPHIVLFLNATGRQNITVSYYLVELDGQTADQRFAIQYRIGESGNFTNIPNGGTCNGAVSGLFDGASNQDFNVTCTLPAAVNNQAQVQVRIITNDAVGSDCMVGVDDIVVSSSALTYSVIYNGNTNTGGTAPVDGSSPYASGATVGVLGPGDLVKTGYQFGGWNTAANGSGTQYSPGQIFAINASTTLYAQWITPLCSGLDTTFDTDGRVTTTVGGSDSIASIALQPDGKIVAAGSSAPFGAAAAVARYNTNGSLDTSFDTDGKILLGTFTNRALDTALQTDGKIVIAGYTYDGVSKYDSVLYRLNANGSPDTSFSGDGTAQVDLGGQITIILHPLPSSRTAR
ncbi:MAG: InlB B-repeat-containing protein [Acidobacteria bacterium]|nr:InlB B-repeat-containing protein [Acidobacteriota bacterium]